MTYLVMECHPAYAVVLDQAGRVIKVANMGYEVGQKVDYVIEHGGCGLSLPCRSGRRGIWGLLPPLRNRAPDHQSGCPDVRELHGPGSGAGRAE